MYSITVNLQKSATPFTRENKYDIKCSPPFSLVEHTVGGKEHRGEKGRGETGGVYLPSQLERTPTTSLVMVDRVKGGGPVIPPPSTGWAEFTIMMDCVRQKGGYCQSVFVLSRLWEGMGLPISRLWRSDEKVLCCGIYSIEVL